MSDDDKIRLQLHVDISAWTNEIEKMHVDRKSVEKLVELNELVQSCTRIKIDSWNWLIFEIDGVPRDDF